LFQITAIVLLFQGPSNAWFRSNKSVARSQSEPDAEPAAKKDDQLPSDGAGSSRSGDNGVNDIPQLKYVAFAAAVGAGICLMNALFWASILPHQSPDERQHITFLILGGLLPGGTFGGCFRFLIPAIREPKPN
jgi:hypothetical protein